MRYIYSIALIAAISFSCFYAINKKQSPINFNKIYKAPSEGPKARKEWDRKRLVNPETGIMPKSIRNRELAFSQEMPNDLNNSNLNWTANGPFNVGGRTRALAMDVQDENILIAGGASGGIWRSTNLGQNWSKMTKSFQLHNVTCVKQDIREGKNNIWYHGTGELTGSSASGGDAYFDGNGIYKSEDGGLSWNAISGVLVEANGDTIQTSDNNPAGSFNEFDFIWNIALDHTNLNEDVIYAATYGSIHKSTDGGLNWERQLGGGSAYYNNVEITSNGVVYATLSSDGTDKGIWRSSNGNDWTNIKPDEFPDVYGRTAIGINPSNENEVYFLTSETEGQGQFTNTFFEGQTWTSLWKYTYLCDNGQDSCGTWVDLSENIPANRPTTFDNFNSQGGYDLLIKVKPDEPNVVFIGGTNLWRSTDGFTSDENTSQIGGYYEGSDHGYDNWDIYNNHHPDQHELLFLPSDPNKILSGNDGGVYISQNCLSTPHIWQRLNNGYQTTQLYSVVMGKDTSDLIIGGFQDNGNFLTNSQDPTSDWVMPFNGDGSYNAVSDNEEDFYLQIQRGVLFKMKLNENGEVIAYNRMDPLGADTNRYEFINYLCMDPNEDDILYYPNGTKLWRNNTASSFEYNNSQIRTNQGWELFSDSTKREITCIDVSTSPANTVYLGTSGKYIYKIENANSGDASFTEINNLPTGYNTNISAIEIDPTNDERILVVSSNYNTYSLFFSQNGGENWTRVAGNLEENLSGGGNGPSLRTAEIAVLGSDTLYLVGGSTGLYATKNLRGLDTEWTIIGAEQFGGVVVENIRFRDSDGKLVVGTHGTGIYSTKINSVYDVFPIWSYDCNEGDCITIVDGSAEYASREDCQENCLEPLKENRIYPNPSSNFSTIEWNSSLLLETATLSNSEGKILQKWNIEGTDLLNIKTSHLSSGLYFITLTGQENKVVQKLIISN
ncbi:MAG: T9SS type A sorting domain-containing protein [Flavobacteriales bacterium]